MTATHILPFLCFALFAARRLLRYLHIFQQEDYTPRRFLRWMIGTRAFDRRLTAGLLALSVIIGVVGSHLPQATMPVMVSALFVLVALCENDPRKIAKKKLVMTQRARRIYGVALLLCLMVATPVAWAQVAALWIVAVQFAPLALALANILLMPFENHIQRRIMRQASDRLAQIAPHIVGITGSFGKTSVKHILGHILEMNAPTLYTPGSVNTLMGISRVIRENLHAGIRYFLVEMGAYGQGSIAKLCGLTPPRTGIITAIGAAHYERFKTLDAVARAKFELAEAVLRHADGKMVIHQDALRREYARQFMAAQRDRFIVVGQGAEADVAITAIDQTASGLSVACDWNGQSYALFAPLYGDHHAGNIVLAFAAAVALGVTPDRAVAALRTTPQITHRLEVKPQPDGGIIIDDAFNSNPRGFGAALDLLALLATEHNSRAILMTPGMIELGDKHAEAHRELGEHAARTADIALVIRADHIPTFVAAFRAAAPHKTLHTFANLAQAREWLRANGQPRDILLIENDLPDLGEARLVL